MVWWSGGFIWVAWIKLTDLNKVGLWQIKRRSNDKTHGNFLSTLVSSTGCMCDQTRPPHRLTKLTQTWKTERSILPPTPPSCPRPPPPLLLAPLQGVVETMKGKWKSDGKISLNMFGSKMREGLRRLFYQPPIPLSECRRSGIRTGWGCGTVLKHQRRAVMASEPTSSHHWSFDRLFAQDPAEDNHFL